MSAKQLQQIEEHVNKIINITHHMPGGGGGGVPPTIPSPLPCLPPPAKKTVLDPDEEEDVDDDNYEEIEPQFLLQLVGLSTGRIICRPSAVLHSHSVADVLCDQVHPTQPIQCYSSLQDCSGLVQDGMEVFVAYTSDKKDIHPKCSHIIYLSVFQEGPNEQIIAVYPKVAHELVECALEKNYITVLKNMKQFKRDIPMFVEDKINTRFDFCGICEDDIPFLIKVTNVPFADYSDLPVKERKKKDYSRKNKDSKIALYPDFNHRKSIIDAETMKCIQDMTTIKRESVIRCILCYVVQRTDTDRFQPSAHDEAYRVVLREAVEAGIIIMPIMVSWTRDGKAYFIRDDLPVIKF